MASYRLASGHVREGPTVVGDGGQVGLQGQRAVPIPRRLGPLHRRFEPALIGEGDPQGHPGQDRPGVLRAVGGQFVPQRFDGEFADQRPPGASGDMLGHCIHPQDLRPVHRRPTGRLDRRVDGRVGRVGEGLGADLLIPGDHQIRLLENEFQRLPFHERAAVGGVRSTHVDCRRTRRRPDRIPPVARRHGPGVPAVARADRGDRADLVCRARRCRAGPGPGRGGPVAAGPRLETLPPAVPRSGWPAWRRCAWPRGPPPRRSRAPVGGSALVRIRASPRAAGCTRRAASVP